ELDESAAEAEPAPGSSVEPQVVNASQEFVKAINQLDQDGVDAQTIGVKWDTTSKQYVIHVAQTPLIAMNGNVILPSTTKDKAEDALQITNRLRRQIGNVKPLKKIEGQPPRPVKKVAVAPTNVRRYQQGWASWYGPGFHGNLTADGTRYNQFGLTAAHRTLPFGTRLRVTNQNNGRSVVVVVNDRGPFIHNRVIDLSMGAAQVLGVINSGVAPVTLDILR
ncbi:MAG: septal ring lytic transglycosylase RlpA family protein, partial [Cyanobacteria bacterium P01_F01_bin.42]